MDRFKEAMVGGVAGCVKRNGWMGDDAKELGRSTIGSLRIVDSCSSGYRVLVVRTPVKSRLGGRKEER